MLTTVTSAAVERQEQRHSDPRKSRSPSSRRSGGDSVQRSKPVPSVTIEPMVPAKYLHLSCCRQRTADLEDFAHYVSEHNVAPGQNSLTCCNGPSSIARKERVVESPMRQPTDMSDAEVLRTFGCHAPPSNRRRHRSNRAAGGGGLRQPCDAGDAATSGRRYRNRWRCPRHHRGLGRRSRDRLSGRAAGRGCGRRSRGGRGRREAGSLTTRSRPRSAWIKAVRHPKAVEAATLSRVVFLH